MKQNTHINKKNTNINSPNARKRNTEKFSKKIFPRSRNRVKISAKIRDIIHGYIMSDGYVDPLGRLTVDQGKEQANFVEWLYHELEPIRTNYPISNVRRTRKSKTRGPINTYSRRFIGKKNI